MNYPLADAFLTMLWFFLWIMWIFLLFRIMLDVFRDDSLSGWGKAGWLVFVLVLPFLGVLVYLIARGGGMGHRAADRARARRQATAPGGQADQLRKLADLKADGMLSDEEFQRAKAKLLA